MLKTRRSNLEKRQIVRNISKENTRNDMVIIVRKNIVNKCCGMWCDASWFVDQGMETMRINCIDKILCELVDRIVNQVQVKISHYVTQFLFTINEFILLLY